MGILWRKRRLRLAEAAAHQQGLEDATEPYKGTVKAALVHLDSGKQIERVVDAIRATPEKTAEESRDLNEDESMTAKAVAILDAGKPRAYENAIAALRADTREWWEDVLSRDPEDFDEGETPFTPDADGLRQFIERDLQPWYVQRRKELENRPLIRAQAFGQSLDPDKLSRLARYEVGTACVIPEDLPVANCSDLVVIQKPEAVVADYLCFYLNSLASVHVEAGTVGVALTHFITNSVATMALPLSPLAEQHRIVAKVDELMALCDWLEVALTAADTTRQRLLEALLHEALAPASTPI